MKDIIKKNIKIIIVLIMFTGVFIACNKEDELPPRNIYLDTKIKIEKPSVLTDAEYKYIESRKAEYRNATN